MTKELVIITNAYPYTEKEIFLENEIPFLLKKFSKIILIPLHFDGEGKSLPPNVEVFSLLAKNNCHNSFIFKVKKCFKIIFKKKFYLEAKKNKAFHNLKILRHLLGFFSYTYEGSEILKDLIKERPQLKNAVFYSYWLHAHASILARIKKKYYPDLKIISRAHGYDIYEEDYFPFFIPLREYTISEMDQIFPISRNGQDYLINKFSRYKNRFSLSNLGTLAQPFMKRENKDSTLSLVSCSSLISLKRIDVLIKSIAFVAKELPKISICWNHLGGGVLFDLLKKIAKETLPINVTWKIHGTLSLENVYQFYKKNEVDIFLSSSETEGIPVSMMEAQSFGIPIIATNVGGVSEIVSENNGILLSSSADEKEIAHAIIFFFQNHHLSEEMRKNAFSNWEKNFDAEKNYTKFADDLFKLT